VNGIIYIMNKEFRYRMRYSIALMFFAMVVSLSAFGQQKIQISSNQQVLSFVHYSYAEQQGHADENGFIELNYIDNSTLLLSHVAFGKLVYTDEKMKEAFKLGVLTIDENSLIGLKPVTVVALRSQIDQQSLGHQDKLSHDAGAFLNQISGVTSIRKGGSYGFDPVLRGFKYEQINIVVNGCQSALAACPNRMDPPASQVSLNTIETVEVMKGPHALRYGSSLGGTINFTSSPLVFSDSLQPTGRLSTAYESNGNIVRSEALVGFTTKHFDLKLLGAWSKGDDYVDGNQDDVASAFERYSYGFDLGVKINEAQNIRFRMTNNIAKDVLFVSLPMDLRSDDTWLNNVEHTVSFTDRKLSSVQTMVYYTEVDHVMDNYEKPIDPRMVDAITWAETRILGGRSETIFNLDNNKLYAGIDAKNEYADGIRERAFVAGPKKDKTMYDNVWQQGNIDKVSAFGEYHINDNIWYTIVSGRLTYNKAWIDDKADEFVKWYGHTYSEHINPSLSVGSKRYVGQDFSVGMWGGRTQRSASITERYINYFPVGVDPYELLGNPELNPEVNNQLDLTVAWEKKDVKIQADLFSAYLTDYISAEIRTDLSPRMPTAPGVRQFVNINKASMMGFELAYQHQLNQWLSHQIQIAYTQGTNLGTKEALAEIPPLDATYRVIGSFLQDKLQSMISFRQVLKQDRIASSFGESASPAFSLLDAQASYQLNNHIQIRTGVQNLLDETYYEHLNRTVKGANPHPIYAPGRNVYLSLNMKI